MLKMLIPFVLILAIYMFFPFFLTRCLGIGVLKRKKKSDKIAFTFDDGPNPLYTPELLDLLKKWGIKASFFVLGSKADKYPDLILRMHKEGHLIGIHNYVHTSNWFMPPWTVRLQLKKSASVIEKITGDRPKYYRPPWGILNFFDLLLLKNYKIILWSVMAEDWRSKGGSEKIKHRLLKNIKNGDVILLHDCGETVGADEDAPKNTILALREVFKEVKHAGFSCVRIDKL